MKFDIIPTSDLIKDMNRPDATECKTITNEKQI